MAEIDDLSFETDEVVAAESSEDSLFGSLNSIVSFVTVTKTKTLAAYGQIVDVLFGNNKFPLSVEPSVLPDGVAESVHINVDPNAGPAGERC